MLIGPSRESLRHNGFHRKGNIAKPRVQCRAGVVFLLVTTSSFSDSVKAIAQERKKERKKERNVCLFWPFRIPYFDTFLTFCMLVKIQQTTF